MNSKNKKEKSEAKKENKMKEIDLDTVVLHCSTADPGLLDRYFKLLTLITKRKPIKTLAKRRIPTWKIRPGLEIGCKVTLRKKRAEEVLKMVFTGLNEISEKQFNNGFLSFGIKEYIEIPSIPYQREIGIIGFDVVATLKRKGLRVKKKKIKQGKIPFRHKITKAETVEFFKKNFKIEII